MRAVLCGYYGMGNGGDEALLATLLQMLPAHVTPIVLSGNPAETSDRYGVETCPRKSLQVLQALRRSDAFIWGGGSLMQDATSVLSPFYYGGLMGLAQQLGLKTIAWAQGIGPLQRLLTRKMTQAALKGCTAVSVRDNGSAALLANWQIPFTLAADPVWALESVPVPGLWDIPAPRVAVALRSHPQLTPQRLEMLTQALADFQKATQTSILLIPFQPVQDLAIAQAIQPRLSGISHILTLPDPQQLKGVFRGVEMTIAMRFHGLIMAAASECRCFGISYDPKVSQLMQDLEFPGWELAQMPTSAVQMSREWIELYANGEAVSSDRIHALIDRALIHQELLSQVLS
ncbi:MAG: polysaccharide pyruvyl transferase CsaB [Drouetiella hepatica Uher 2000/2452]|jgi:polysaccharide pyruvyl transferase CsaB|uniref:Polysaccharide pyruvyl transferase CsaB n=1 Tax=Drouetiella hepatica Uher 2000/2452 TaxID=904376 RepID=A0A951QFJ0_9CYAN|nr:polysaccharide pyruvyl transferase CsaB [Drouetiella hepatica Uher 2000/2452]